MTPVTNFAGIYREQASPVCKQTRMMASILSFSVSSAARPLSSNLSRNLSCLRAGGATIAGAYTYRSRSNPVILGIPSSPVTSVGQGLLPTDYRPKITVKQGAVLNIFVARDLDFSGLVVDRP